MPNAKQNGQITLSKTTRMVWNAGSHPPLLCGLPAVPFKSSGGTIQASSGIIRGIGQMDHPESTSIIMMLALSALLGVIILICWCRDLWQERAAIRWATQPLVDSADNSEGPESVQHGLRDADMDLAAATDQAISLSLRQCELAVQNLIAIGSAEENPGQNDRPLVGSVDKGDGPE